MARDPLSRGELERGARGGSRAAVDRGAKIGEGSREIPSASASSRASPPRLGRGLDAESASRRCAGSRQRAMRARPSLPPICGAIWRMFRSPRTGASGGIASSVSGERVRRPSQSLGSSPPRLSWGSWLSQARRSVSAPRRAARRRSPLRALFPFSVRRCAVGRGMRARIRRRARERRSGSGLRPRIAA